MQIRIKIIDYRIKIKVIKCNSPFRYSDICVACMDAQQSCGGTIICDIAEDYDYEEQDILVCCKYGELINKDLRSKGGIK